MTEYPQPALYQRFLRGLALSPDGPALRIGSEEVTYRALHEHALTLAGSLGSAKVVGVLAGKSVTAYAGILAGLYAGATVVPLHPDFPPSRTRRMLELSGTAAVIADDRGRAALRAAHGDAPAVPVVEPDPAQALSEPRPVEASDVAYMLFTSGSTGRPKGVPITHGSTHHYFRLLDARYDFSPDDVFTQTFDLNFDCAMFDLFCAWGSGATVVPRAAGRLPRHARPSSPSAASRCGSPRPARSP